MVVTGTVHNHDGNEDGHVIAVRDSVLERSEFPHGGHAVYTHVASRCHSGTLERAAADHYDVGKLHRDESLADIAPTLQRPEVNAGAQLGEKSSTV